MRNQGKRLLLFISVFSLFVYPATAQTVKQLKAKQDVKSQLWGYRNVGDKSYWWKEAHSMGEKEKLLNYGYDTEWVIPAQYDRVGKSFSEGLVAVELNGRVGFIDSFNRFIIAPQYEPVDNLHGFSLGLSAVKQGGKYGFINKKGEFVIPPIFDYAENFDKDLLAVVKLEKKFGAIDLNGEIMVSCKYLTKEAMKLLPGKNKEYRNAIKNVEARNHAGCYEKTQKATHHVSEEVQTLLRDSTYSPSYSRPVIAKNGSFWGLKCTKTDSAWVLSPTYTSLTPMEDGFYLLANERGKGVADVYGRIILPCKYSSISYQSDEHIFFVCSSVDKDGKNAKIGLYNRLGGMILPCILSRVSKFSNGNADAEIDAIPITVDRNGMVSDECINRLLEESEGKSFGYLYRIIGLRPTCAQAHNNIGIMDLNGGEYKGGIARLKIAHELSPADPLIAENLKQAKSERKERRFNRAIAILSATSAVAGTVASAYSVATGTSAGATSGGWDENLGGNQDLATTRTTESQKKSEPASSSKDSDWVLKLQYDKWARNAKSIYEHMTLLGDSEKDKNGKDSGGTTLHGMGSVTYIKQKQLLREAQREMKKIREKARKKGINIPKSEYEDIKVTY